MVNSRSVLASESSRRTKGTLKQKKELKSQPLRDGAGEEGQTPDFMLGNDGNAKTAILIWVRDSVSFNTVCAR